MVQRMALSGSSFGLGSSTRRGAGHPLAGILERRASNNPRVRPSDSMDPIFVKIPHGFQARYVGGNLTVPYLVLK